MRKLFLSLFILASLVSTAQVKISAMPLYTGNGDSALIPVILSASPGANRKMYGVDLAKGRLDSIVAALETIGVTTDAFPTSGSTNPVQSNGVYVGFGTKVDKIVGKGLSTNDFTDPERTKLINLPDGSNAAVKNADNSFTAGQTVTGAIRQILDGPMIFQTATAFQTNGLSFRIQNGTTEVAFLSVNTNSGEVKLGAGPGGYFTTLWSNNIKVATLQDDGDIELHVAGKGIILRAPDGTAYKATIANGGTWNITTP